MKRRTRDLPARERCPVLVGAAGSHCCTLACQEAISALGCPNLASCRWVPGLGLPIGCCPADSISCVFLTFARRELWFVFPSALQPKLSMKSYRHVFILETYNAFLFWLRLTDRLESSCKAIWEKNKDRQTDSNGMTLISLGNQAKNGNVTSDPLLRASPLKARIRTDISQIRKDMWRLLYSCDYIKGVKKRN